MNGEGAIPALSTASVKSETNKQTKILKIYDDLAPNKGLKSFFFPPQVILLLCMHKVAVFLLSTYNCALASV